VEEPVKKAFDFAADLAKQLITLSTGIITITIAFSKDFLPSTVTADTKRWAMCAWYAFLVSIVCGVWSLMALTGTLEPKAGTNNNLSIRGANVTLPASLQILSFLVGLLLTIVFATAAF
jgi:uncharacterized membrane protein (DUF485 family)